LTVLKVKGSKVQKYEVLCTVCECFVGSDDEVYIVGKQVFHEICLAQLLSQPEREFEDTLKVIEGRSWYTSLPEEVLKGLVGGGELQIDTVEELRRLYSEKGLSIGTEVKLEDIVEEGFKVPEDVVVTPLSKLQVSTLACRSRSIIEKALKDVGLIEEIGVKEPTPEQYSNFILKIEEGVLKMLKNPEQVEFRRRVGDVGPRDIDIYVNGRYIGTWKITKSYTLTLWNWIHRWIERVSNLLTLLAMIGLIREELLEWESTVVPGELEAIH